MILRQSAVSWPSVKGLSAESASVSCDRLRSASVCYKVNVTTLTVIFVSSMGNLARLSPSSFSNRWENCSWFLCQEWQLGGDWIHSSHEACLGLQINRSEGVVSVMRRVHQTLSQIWVKSCTAVWPWFQKTLQWLFSVPQTLSSLKYFLIMFLSWLCIL